MTERAPLAASVIAQLRADAQNIRATAERKQVTLNDWEERREREAAQEHFDLGCWLFYYRHRIGLEDGIRHRIDCARRLFLAGIKNPGYRFFTVFDFGERQFDTIFEMGDADQVFDGLRELAHQDRTGRIQEGLDYFGCDPRQLSIF